jgi:hypothetical protein
MVTTFWILDFGFWIDQRMGHNAFLTDAGSAPSLILRLCGACPPHTALNPKSKI